LVQDYSQREQCITYAAPTGVSSREIALAPQAKLRRQCEPPWHRAQTKILPKRGGALTRWRCAAAAALGYQLAPTLGAPPREHFSAILGSHARTETVGTLAAHFARLISPLHGVGLRFGFPWLQKKGGKAKPLSAKVSIQ
jgi:hypothetical protein